jgi:hypothetical protein
MQLTNEQIAQHMMAQAQHVQQHGYASSQLIHTQAQHPGYGQMPQAGVMRSQTPSGTNRMLPAYMQMPGQYVAGANGQQGPESVGSPSTDSGMSAKRQAGSPMDGGSVKKAKLSGKRPSE